jgi:hypothetical protein
MGGGLCRRIGQHFWWEHWRNYFANANANAIPYA